MWLIMEFFLELLTRRYIFPFTKYEHKDISESVDFDDRRFSSMKPQQNFLFFTQVDFTPGVL